MVHPPVDSLLYQSQMMQAKHYPSLKVQALSADATQLYDMPYALRGQAGLMNMCWHLRICMRPNASPCPYVGQMLISHPACQPALNMQSSLQVKRQHRLAMPST